MPIRRRETHVTGAVRFPVDDPEHENTSEGGMFVRAMVAEPGPGDPERSRKAWMECSGGTAQVLRDEVPLSQELEYTLWPGLYKDPETLKDTGTQDAFSVPCLAVITLGSTGWSGWHTEREEYWQCSENDLTEAGQAIIASLRTLYPGRTVYLSTWLDT